MSPPRTADVVVVGAGVVGAACAYFAARAGLRTVVLDRGGVAGGTSSGGEGNLLVSDKSPGPELELALLAHRIWHGELAEHHARWEFEAKGGLVVTPSAAGLETLRALATAQRAAGVTAVDVGADGLAGYEPELAAGLAGGVYYPQDAQVQPMLLAAHLLRLARELGVQVLTRTPVVGLQRAGDRVVGVRTATGTISSGTVVNAAGTWAGEVAALAGVTLPVLPRRGFVLVTQPTAVVIRHKVYGADYVTGVASSEADLQTSPVVESTRSGTVLIGSSRERVGFDARVVPEILGVLARDAAALFPALAGICVIRSYHGFRPYCPDHLPVIGLDPRAPGLAHACGHEGAGVGLSVATGALLIQQLTGRPTAIDVGPFAPERFVSLPADEVTVG